LKTNFLDAALKYDGIGWVTIPIAESKRPPRGFSWAKYQEQRPTNTELCKSFTRSNLAGLAVVLGPVSNGLYCRDFDQAQAYDQWADAHPQHASTLPTVKTSRGQHVYFSSEHSIPTRVYADGELRGVGAYVVLPPSVHDSGHVYDWVSGFPKQTPALIDPDAIGLCNSYEDVPIVHRGHREHRSHKRTQRTQEVEGRGVEAKDSGLSLEKVLNEAAATGFHQNHHKLFHLARGVKALEKQQDREFSDSELREIFMYWYERSQEFLRPEQGFDEYRFEFLDGLERVKYPLGEEIISQAWERAISLDPPEEASQFQSLQVRILVALCRELQRMTGDEPFYLACRTVQRLFLHDTHTTAAHWLKGLRSTNIIEVVERGTANTRRATLYRYRASRF
jgi:hypothetical protein